MRRRVLWFAPPRQLNRYAALTVLSYHFGVKVREVIRLLEDGGWYLARTKGSHRQFKHRTKRGTVTVSGQSGIDVPPGTLNSILKQAGLK